MKKNKSELKNGSPEKVNPLELLKEDHRVVKKMFDEFEQSEEDKEKEEIAIKAIKELKVHAAIEEEIFYPKVREYFKDNEEEMELLDEAHEEHHVVHLLIGELDGMDSEDACYFAKFTVLAENVRHHIKEEEGEMFPKLKGAKNELEEIADQLVQRKEELKAQEGIEEEEKEESSYAVSQGGRRKSGNKTRSKSR